MVKVRWSPILYKYGELDVTYTTEIPDEELLKAQAVEKAMQTLQEHLREDMNVMIMPHADLDDVGHVLEQPG